MCARTGARYGDDAMYEDGYGDEAMYEDEERADGDYYYADDGAGPYADDVYDAAAAEGGYEYEDPAYENHGHRRGDDDYEDGRATKKTSQRRGTRAYSR